MSTEFEAKYLKIDKDEIRERLNKAGAKLARPEFLQRRYNFDVPEASGLTSGWVRLRDEGDKITLTIKVIPAGGAKQITGQKELEVIVDSFDKTKELLNNLGLTPKNYQETKREKWLLGSVEVDIDQWPFLEPFVEIEADSEEAVKNASIVLGFDYSQAVFCHIATLYALKYGFDERVVTQQTPRLTFEMDNPFVV